MAKESDTTFAKLADLTVKFLVPVLTAASMWVGSTMMDHDRRLISLESNSVTSQDAQELLEKVYAHQDKTFDKVLRELNDLKKELVELRVSVPREKWFKDEILSIKEDVRDLRRVLLDRAPTSDK